MIEEKYSGCDMDPLHRQGISELLLVDSAEDEKIVDLLMKSKTRNPDYFEHIISYMERNLRVFGSLHRGQRRLSEILLMPGRAGDDLRSYVDFIGFGSRHDHIDERALLRLSLKTEMDSFLYALRQAMLLEQYYSHEIFQEVTEQMLKNIALSTRHGLSTLNQVISCCNDESAASVLQDRYTAFSGVLNAVSSTLDSLATTASKDDLMMPRILNAILDSWNGADRREGYVEYISLVPGDGYGYWSIRLGHWFGRDALASYMSNHHEEFDYNREQPSLSFR